MNEPSASSWSRDVVPVRLSSVLCRVKSVRGTEYSGVGDGLFLATRHVVGCRAESAGYSPTLHEAAEKTTDEPSKGSERLLSTATTSLAVFQIVAPFPVCFLVSVRTTRWGTQCDPAPEYALLSALCLSITNHYLLFPPSAVS